MVDLVVLVSEDHDIILRVVFCKQLLDRQVVPFRVHNKVGAVFLASQLRHILHLARNIKCLA